jgi:hypothetical protein
LAVRHDEKALKVMEKFFSKGRSECVRQLAAGLDRTVWGKGIYTEKLALERAARPESVPGGVFGAKTRGVEMFR